MEKQVTVLTREPTPTHMTTLIPALMTYDPMTRYLLAECTDNFRGDVKEEDGTNE